METVVSIVQWFTNHWVELGAGIVLVNSGLLMIAELTPWKWDDNVVRIISNMIKQLFPEKKQE